MSRIPVVLAAALLVAGCRSSSAEHGTLSSMGRSWKTLGGEWSATADGVVGSGGWLMSEDTFGDATIDVDIDHVSGQGGRTLGVGFRYQPWTVAAKSSGYGVNLTTGATTYNVFKGTSGAWNPVNPAFKTFQPSPAIHPAKNHVQIRSHGASHVVWINGQQVSAFEDGAYPKGGLNFWVESTVDKVRFSNLRVVQ